MDEQEIMEIWKSYDKKLEEARVLNMQSWALNLRWFESMKTGMARSKMNALVGFNTLAVVLGALYIVFLSVLVWGNHFKNIYFSSSILAILLINFIVTVVYIKHIVMIRRIDFNGSVIITQERMARLQASTIGSAKIAWLQLPFYSTWFWNWSWITGSPFSFWLIAFPVTLLFVFLAIWLYVNISEKNVNKRWFKILFNTPEWKSVRKAMAFIDEIELFKKEL